MSLVIIKRARVDVDLLEYFDHIAEDKLDPALRFLEIAEKAFERLAENPRIGTRWSSSKVRTRDVRTYPMPSPYRSYIIFYRVYVESIEILAVMHGALDLEKKIYEVEW